MLDRAVLIAHRVVPIQAVRLVPLDNVSVMSVHEVALDVTPALSVRNRYKLSTLL